MKTLVNLILSWLFLKQSDSESVVGAAVMLGKVFAKKVVTTPTLVTTHAFPSLAPINRIQVPGPFLELPRRTDLLHRAVIYERDGMRQGTASSKTRAEVSGSTKKMRPQKGSGRARMGTRRAPHLKGGGRAHGPKPRDFSTELPNKVYNLAMRGAFSLLFKAGKMIVVDGKMSFRSNETAQARQFFERHGFVKDSEVNGRTLFITSEERRNLELSCQDLGKLGEVVRLDELLISELLKYPRVLIEQDALLQTEESSKLRTKYKQVVVDQILAADEVSRVDTAPISA